MSSASSSSGTSANSPGTTSTTSVNQVTTSNSPSSSPPASSSTTSTSAATTTTGATGSTSTNAASSSSGPTTSSTSSTASTSAVGTSTTTTGSAGTSSSSTGSTTSSTSSTTSVAGTGSTSSTTGTASGSASTGSTGSTTSSVTTSTVTSSTGQISTSTPFSTTASSVSSFSTSTSGLLTSISVASSSTTSVAPSSAPSTTTAQATTVLTTTTLSPPSTASSSTAPATTTTPAASSSSPGGSPTSVTTTYAPPPPPNYSALAVPVALSSVAQAAVGTLCSGVNVSPAVSQPLPVTTGAYNYQKVQLNSYPSVYEVECWMNAGSTGGTVTNMPGQYFSLESCMDACSAAGPGSCLVAYWASTTRICSLYSRVNNGGSPSLAGGQSPAKIVGSGVRTARLLTGQPVPNVVDATYLLAPGADLGLCTNNNYHLTFIGVYYNGASGTGPATINVNRDNIWYASCGASFQNAQSGVQITPVYSIGTPLFGFTSAPTTPDDCARVCQSYHSAFLLAGNTGIDCNLWQFVPAASTQCQLYPSNAGVVSGSNPATLRDGQNNNIFAAGLLRGNSGTEFSSQAQYKKRSLAGRMEYNRRHARDSLIDDGSIPDVILKLDRRTGNWTEVL
ncbi:hypothetical protein FOPE_11366 [Fonsecaea pedrosoi]|nr:hypothetical protein FOPE_11366 [Fonsecaea pedrosoi]